MSQMFRLCRLFVERHANGCLLLGCIPRVGGSLSAPVLCMPRRCHIPISRACQPSLVINLRVLTVASLWSSHISAGTKIQLKMSNQVVYLRQRGMMEMRGGIGASRNRHLFTYGMEGLPAGGDKEKRVGGNRCPTPSGPSGVCLSGGDSCSVWCTAQQANRRQGSCDGDVAMASRVWAPLG